MNKNHFIFQNASLKSSNNYCRYNYKYNYKKRDNYRYIDNELSIANKYDINGQLIISSDEVYFSINSNNIISFK